MNLEAKIQATEKIAETYDKEKADNITYEDSKIQLTSNGEKIGEKHGELKKSKEIAKKLLEKNISIEIIEETTGLTKEEIEKLKK